MKEVLKQISVSDYDLFRAQVKERLHWNNTQFNDRKNGRIKIHPLEMEIIKQIVAELPCNKPAK